MQTKNSNQQQLPPGSEKPNDEDFVAGAMDRLALHPTRTGVAVLSHERYEGALDRYGPYASVAVPKPVGHQNQSTPPPYRMPPHPLPPLPGAIVTEPPTSSLHTHSSKFPIEREVKLSTGEKNNKIPILSEYNKRPKSAVAPEGPTKHLAWTDNAKRYVEQENCSMQIAENSHSSYISTGIKQSKQNLDADQKIGGGGGGSGTKEDKTKITKTYHTIKDMISSRFNRTKDNAEEQKQMNNQTILPNGSDRGHARGGEMGMGQGTSGETRRAYEGPETVAEPGIVHRVYGSRERLVDGFGPEGGNQRANARDQRAMPPLPVLRGNHHPNFSGVSDVISPIPPVSPQQQQHQRRMPQTYETEILSHQQIQRKMQNQLAGTAENGGHYSTARAHLVQMMEGGGSRSSGQEPIRHVPPAHDPVYGADSRAKEMAQQRRPPPPPTPAKPMHPRSHPPGGDLSPRSSPILADSHDANLTANLESNGVYISKNPKFSPGEKKYPYGSNPIYASRPATSMASDPNFRQGKKDAGEKESETDDDDGGFKRLQVGNRDRGSKEKREGEDLDGKKEVDDVGPERPGSRSEILAVEEGSRNREKVSSGTSSDYEKATGRSLEQVSSLGDSGRGSAAYSSGRQDSERTGAERREKASRVKDLRSEGSSDHPEVTKPGEVGGQLRRRTFSGGNDSEWVEVVESELRQILDPKLHGLNRYGSGRGEGSTVSESVSSLTPPLPPLSPAGGSSPTPTPRHARHKHSSLAYGSKSTDYDSKTSGKGQRGGKSNWTGRIVGKSGGDKSRSGGSNSRNSKVALATFGIETDLASTTTGPLESVPDSRLSDRTSDEDLSTTIDATDALAIRRQLQGLENMYSEVLKLLGVKKYGGGSRYHPSEPRNKRRYGSMSSLPSSVSSRPMRDKRRDDRKKVKDSKGINKRFQRLESHVVTLARSVAHLSSEMRTQHLMIQEMENIRSEISSMRNQGNLNARSQSVPRALNSMLVSPSGGGGGNGGAGGDKGDPSALTNPARVKKLTKFFGDEPPLLRLFLKKLGYEKYAAAFENEKIGMVELPYLTEERLQKMGIPMGPRLRILQEAQISFCRDSVYVV